jgi:hypothetical protein
MTVEATTNEHKAALRLLGVLPALGGTVVTADAMFTHADVCAGIQQKQGDYILYARKNQAELRAQLADTFAAPLGGEFSPPGSVRGGMSRCGRQPRRARDMVGWSTGRSPRRRGSTST